ncbi:MAG: T9SS type A sorting domain-containing protein [Candidatus Latescibacteria bacterium]|nr:T9SS type A sorting domain-containing protein [Candidatus Latescibacterota bacterium]
MLKLSADPVIQYDFDGSQLDIPVDVSGTSAGIVFLVYTRGQAANIPATTNGFLGWHYVSKIDTCVYYSGLKSVNSGATTISWDGKDQDGGKVPAGEYTYYLWAYDNAGNKVQMSEFLPSGWGFDYYSEIMEVDEQGLPLDNPFWFTRNLRWKFGGDPQDSTLVETTTITLAEGWGLRGDPVIQPDDFNYFYVSVGNSESTTGSIQKFKWVPDGDAEVQSDWGDGGYAETFGTAGGGSPGCASDNTYLFTGDENHVASTDPDSQFYIYDFDGSMLAEVDLTPWWSSPEALEVGAQMNGGPNNFAERGGYVFLNCHCNCLNQMVDPATYLETEDSDDFFKWSNGNGDYTLDHNFEETAALPWVCNDYNVGPYKYCISPDANFFTAVNAYDVGAVSFGLLAPDGTGLGYYAFAGETAGWKKGELFCDGDTPFDGCYCDNEHLGGTHYEWDKTKKGNGIYFLGHDSISGVITNAVAVADEAPAAFSVAQNSPNPFNPTTTINFSLAQSGDVAVDVFNVAGQKIDTLVDGFMDAGQHSVVWNASGFSAGVYFYTVKSAGFSKTMKMTLVK